jgi:hypothetical protein
MSELIWLCVPGQKPRWLLSAALDPETLTVFMPAAAAANETAVTLSASFDGIPLVSDEGHVYLPTKWLAQEYPEIADLCQKIEKRVLEHFGVAAK